MNKNLELFLTFMKIGAFTFGGGYAMIPLIQKEVCENKKWLGEKDISDIVAISESTPGPIAINAATFVGYKTAGFSGACMATLRSSAIFSYHFAYLPDIDAVSKHQSSPLCFYGYKSSRTCTDTESPVDDVSSGEEEKETIFLCNHRTLTCADCFSGN